LSDQSVSIIVPAYNEEGNIEAALASVLNAVSGRVEDYEIIVIDDGSLDQTAALVQKEAGKNPRIKVFSNAVNRGYGYSFRRGVSLAGKEYVTVFPGDNDMSADSLGDLINARTKAEVIITYSTTPHRRSLFRRLLSMAFVVMMNFLFGLKLKYYNGAFICKTQLLRSVAIQSEGLAVLAEGIVRLIKSGYTYQAIAFEHTGRKCDKSKALTLKSFLAVLNTILILIRDIYFHPEYKKKVSCSI